MKKTIKVNKELYNLKLAVVMHHTGESNAYTRESIARDACFVANNSIQYKCQQMLEVKAEIASLRPTEQAETVSVQLAKKVDIYKRMQLELNELEERFNADMAVHKEVTGDVWKPWKKSSTKDKSQILNDVDDILGKDLKPIQEAN